MSYEYRVEIWNGNFGHALDDLERARELARDGGGQRRIQRRVKPPETTWEDFAPLDGEGSRERD